MRCLSSPPALDPLLTLFGAYLAAHFLAYVVFLRHAARLRTEQGIFFYHFASAVLTGLAGLTAAVAELDGFGFVGLVLVLSVHGIYSLSFLELWSLAQGGYSLSVLRSIERAEASGAEPDFSHLERIGETKQRERLAGLEQLGLIATNDNQAALTDRGGAIATLLRGLLRWIDPPAASGDVK
jgi:hypothetical protein